MAPLLRRRRAEPARAPSIARVLLHRDVLRTVASAAAASDSCETAGPLFGLVQRSWNGRSFDRVACVLGTVSVGRGGPSSVSLGQRGEGERAASALRWLRSVTGLDLIHLGDWHTHP